MGKLFSKNRSDNEGTQDVDQSRKLEVGLVNFDSHSSMSGIGWYEVLEIIGFVILCLIVLWEARKYCLNRSLRDMMTGRYLTASAYPQIPTNPRPAPALEVSQARLPVLQTAMGPVGSIGTVPALDYTTWRDAQ